LRRLPILALLTLLAWVTPTPIHAKEVERPQIFQATLTHEVYGPYEVKTPEPNRVVQKPKTVSKTVPKVSKVQSRPSGRYNPCSCVSYIKSLTGFTQSIGYARNWPVNSKIPTPGAVIITYESRAGHVAIVDHADANWVYIQSEANYSRCRVTYTRKLPLNSPLIKGYWKN